MCNQMRSNRLTLFDIEFGKDDVQSSSVINDALLKNIDKVFLLRLPVGRGGVINSPRFWFFFRVESRRTAHG